MATGKAPMSGGIAIVCGLLLVVIVIIKIISDFSWGPVVSSFCLFVVTVIMWQGFKKQDREYQERMGRLEQRLEGD